MVYAAGPRHVRNVNQTVDTRHDFDEGSKICEVSNRSLDGRSDAVGLRHLLPRIGLGGTQRQRQTPLIRIYFGDDDSDLFIDFQDRPRVFDFLCPRHFADVNQAFHSFFEDDKCAVVDDAHDLTVNAFTHRVFFGHQNPWVLESLLITKRNAFPFAVKAEYDHIDLVTDLEVLGWVAHTAPGDVGYVEQTVETAEVNENPVIGEILDHTVDQSTLLEGFHGLLLDLALRFFEDCLPRQHHVGPAAVEGDDARFDLLLEVILETAVGQQIDQ